MLKQNIKKHIMKEIKIEIPSGHEIDKEKSTFEKIVFRKVEDKYPVSVEELKNRRFYLGGAGDIREMLDCTPNNMSTIERAKGILALIQLVELKDACNEIDGGKDFEIGDSRWNVLLKYDGGLFVSNNKTQTPLQFKKESTAKWFLKTHAELIETAKEFI